MILYYIFIRLSPFASVTGRFTYEDTCLSISIEEIATFYNDIVLPKPLKKKVKIILWKI